MTFRSPAKHAPRRLVERRTGDCGTTNPKRWTLNPQPSALNPKPWTRLQRERDARLMEFMDQGGDADDFEDLDDNLGDGSFEVTH